MHSLNPTMTTAWERITDETFKSWLLRAMTIEEYNDNSLCPPRDRRNLLTEFEEWKKRQIWFLVEGMVERGKNIGGVRLKLMRLAIGAGGYYPQGKDVGDSFLVQNHSTDDDKRLISMSVVFEDKRSANSFITSVDDYITTTSGVTSLGRFHRSTTAPFEATADLVQTSDYTPCQRDGEPPNDSPVWDVELSATELSSKATSYGMDDTVFKYQRIETDRAFARSKADGAHIFPRAKCKGHYAWLDKHEFNRLALSKDGHVNFDGTAKGSVVKAETQPKVALEPVATDEINMYHKQFYRISIRLWCRDRVILESWRPFLPENVGDTNAEGHCYFHGPIYIFCEKNRTHKLLFEEQQNPGGSIEKVCVTAIPGVDDLASLASWKEKLQTVDVYEIIYKLLLWNYNETRGQWRTVS